MHVRQGDGGLWDAEGQGEEGLLFKDDSSCFPPELVLNCSVWFAGGGSGSVSGGTFNSGGGIVADPRLKLLKTDPWIGILNEHRMLEVLLKDSVLLQLLSLTSVHPGEDVIL